MSQVHYGCTGRGVIGQETQGQTRHLICHSEAKDKVCVCVCVCLGGVVVSDFQVQEDDSHRDGETNAW